MMKALLAVNTVLLGLLFTSPAVFAEPVNHQDRKTVTTFCGIQVGELEYRHSDDDAKLEVWDADAFIGSDELKFRWLSRGEYADSGDAFEILSNELVLQKTGIHLF